MSAAGSHVRTPGPTGGHLARTVAFSLVLSACGGTEIIRLDADEPEDSRSAVVILDELTSDGACARMRAATLVDLARKPLAIDAAYPGYGGQHLRASVFFSPLDPDELGLAAGPIPTKSGREGCWTPSPSALLRASVLDGVAGSFQPVAPAEGASELCGCLEGPVRECTTYRVDVTNVGEGGGPNFMLPLGEDRFAVSMGGYQVYTFDVRTGEALAWTLPEGFPAGAVLPLDDGRYWFGGRDGALWQGRLEPALDAAPVSSSSGGGELGWLAGPPDGRELYTLSYTGVLEHYRDGEWTVLHRFPDRLVSEGCGGLLRLLDGELLAVRGSSGRVVSVRDGALRETEISDRNGLCSLTSHPTLGVLLTTSDGQILRRDGSDAWVSLGASGITQAIFAVAPFGEGFVFGGQRGFFGRWAPRRGFCQRMDSVTPDAPGDVYFALPLGEEIFLFGGSLSGVRTNAITRITP